VFPPFHLECSVSVQDKISPALSVSVGVYLPATMLSFTSEY